MPVEPGWPEAGFGFFSGVEMPMLIRKNFSPLRRLSMVLMIVHLLPIVCDLHCEPTTPPKELICVIIVENWNPGEW